MATIKDIARELNISAQAVSRALNDKNNISEALKEKVRTKAKELGYAKNQLASSLRTKETKIIGIFMFRRTFEIRQKVLDGIFTEARKYGYDILFFTLDSELDTNRSYAELCAQRMVDGVIITGIRLDDPHINELKNLEIPTVVLDTEIGGNANMVSMDHEKAVNLSIDYLQNKGYKKIGLITGHIQADITNKVVDYYKNIFISKKDQFIEYSDYTEETGYLCAEKILEKQDRPEVIIAINNPIAMGVLKYANEYNMKVPEELGIIQLNDVTLSSYTSTPLTSIYQNDFDRGVVAIQLIVNKQQGRKVLVEPVLNLRDSV
jgi:LacI family transcriptional regulator